MEIQPLGCCFDSCVLCLRLLVASVADSPAGGHDGAFLTLDLVVRCSSTSGAEIEFWLPGTFCWSPVPSTLRQLENLSVFLGFSRLWIWFSSSHCWSLLHFDVKLFKNAAAWQSLKFLTGTLAYHLPFSLTTLGGFVLTLLAPQDVCNVTLSRWRKAPQDVCDVITNMSRFPFFARHFSQYFKFYLHFDLIPWFLGKKVQSFAKKKKKK